MVKVKLFLIFYCLIGWVNAGNIVVSTNTIPTFGNCPIYFVSDPQRYTLSGNGLTSAIEIVAPEHFEISLMYSTGYASKIAINPVAGNVPTTTIFVRFSPYTSGAKIENILHTSLSSITQTKAVLGTATPTPASGTNAAAYYNLIGSSTGATLKTALYNKILGHSTTSYSGLWSTYINTDKFYNGKVWDIYSTLLDTVSPFEFTFSTNQCGNYAVEGDCYNREHSFPQSWFNQASPMVSDMFHIYPTDGKVNGMRSNFPFGEVSVPTYTTMQGGKLGPNTSSGYTGTVFEPINDYKGDLARSFFYMATRYQNLLVSWNSLGNANDILDGNSFPGYDPWHLALLIKWHNQDPPTAKEIERNNAIYGYQNNRNPFIDSPQYVNRIWGGATALEPTLAASSFFVKSNTSSTALISWKSGNGQRRLVIAKAGSLVNALPTDFQSYAAQTNFGAGAQLGSGNFIVYNGMGSTAEISGLNPSLTYHFLVVEYNGTGAATNYLTSSTLASSAISVPVTWFSFTGEPINEKEVLLKWQTSQEVNTAIFEIERDLGNGFENIGKVNSAGNSQTLSSYQFLDDDLYHQTVIISNIAYRIKQVDKDGRYSYSKQIEINLNELAIASIQVENPMNNGIRLLSNFTDINLDLKLSNSAGKVIFETKTTLNHETFIPLDTELAPGLYILHLMQRTGQQNFKIIKH